MCEMIPHKPNITGKLGVQACLASTPTAGAGVLDPDPVFALRGTQSSAAGAEACNGTSGPPLSLAMGQANVDTVKIEWKLLLPQRLASDLVKPSNTHGPDVQLLSCQLIPDTHATATTKREIFIAGDSLVLVDIVWNKLVAKASLPHPCQIHLHFPPSGNHVALNLHWALQFSDKIGHRWDQPQHFFNESTGQSRFLQHFCSQRRLPIPQSIHLGNNTPPLVWVRADVSKRRLRHGQSSIVRSKQHDQREITNR
mmetsp:Transcript_45536/g.98801  ORF Transcript_45536/g.98801 Transcript_45536/m.98801 type:complete len:254 (+) Transcript_45536:256-1017(+)